MCGFFSPARDRDSTVFVAFFPPPFLPSLHDPMSKPKPAAAAAAAAATAPVEPADITAERLLLALEIANQLRPHAAALREEARKLGAEKDRLNAAWATLTQHISDKKREVAAAEEELSEQAALHAARVAVHKQQLRELLASNAAGAVEQRADALIASRVASRDFSASERELKADRRDLSVVLKELEAGHEDLVRVLRADSDKAMTTLRFQFESQARQLAALYEEKMARCREEMNAQRARDVAVVEKRKGAHVAAMLAAHEGAFADIKSYFNEITHSNLDLIKVRDLCACCSDRGGGAAPPLIFFCFAEYVFHA